MIKRIIEIAQARTHLAIRHGQLIIKRNGEQLSSIPCDDIGVLLVDHTTELIMDMIESKL